eukprot:TRINITY_DN1068_c0_g2_i1.p1 TRINITY_DN1068_c0_g2~~TRINITY_DN1068_c0_g2_i1.p1  ORF type:complete len:169 (+),score=14.64 TRINITY_DN1068_c0_g2_i1:149-655(+)
MKKLIFALLAVGCLAQELLWDSDEEVFGVPEIEPELNLESEPGETGEQLPRPPNNPATACARAKGKNGVYKPWACNQFVNWCYFNNIRTGGRARDYKTWPRVPNWSRTGTVITGRSILAGFDHVGIVCDGNLLCHEPNYKRQPIKCGPAAVLSRRLFRSYTLHYPPGY